MEGLFECGAWYHRATALPEVSSQLGLATHAALLSFRKAVRAYEKAVGGRGFSGRSAVAARWPIHASNDYHRAAVWLVRVDRRL